MSSQDAKPGKKIKRKKGPRKISRGKAFIKATYNNTIVTLTDLNGNVVAWNSAGASGFRGPKKATPYAASVIVKKLMDRMENSGLEQVEVFVRGIGGGRESAIRALGTHGLTITSIRDITPIPHNGCRPPKPRRV